jgi:hypothetical protein
MMARVAEAPYSSYKYDLDDQNPISSDECSTTD